MSKSYTSKRLKIECIFRQYREKNKDFSLINEMIMDLPQEYANWETSKGNTILTLSARYGNINAIKYILNNLNYDINHTNHMGCTGLTFAIMEGYTEIVKILLDHPEIDINMINNPQNMSTIHVAAKYNNIQGLKLLLQHPARNINIVTSTGSTPLNLAVCKGYREIVKLLLNEDDIDVNGKGHIFNNTSLHTAVFHKRIDIIKELLEHPKIDIYATNNMNITPLHIAIKNEYIEIFRLILNHSDISAYDDILQYAGYFNKMNILHILLNEYNFDINAIDKNNDTVLVTTIHQNNINTAIQLLEYPNIDINIQCCKGRTAIMHIINNVTKNIMDNENIEENINIAKLLLEKGVDLTLKDNDGKTAYDLAKESNNSIIIELFN